MKKSIKTYTVKIYLSGDLDTIKSTCRKYCLKGLCVTISSTLFIYTGGEEYGVKIGLINYPRFPSTPNEIFKKAIELAELCREAAHQHSYLVMDGEQTIWNTNREI